MFPWKKRKEETKKLNINDNDDGHDVRERKLQT